MNSQPQSENILSVGDAFAFATQNFREHFAILIALNLVVFSLPGVINVFFPQPLVGLAVAILDVFLMLGFYKIMLGLADGKAPEFGELFSQGRLFFRYLLASILTTIAMVIGFILFIVPGIILCLHLVFYPFLIVDKDLGMIESFKQSSALSAGIRWKLLRFGAIAFCFTLLLTFTANIVTGIPMFIINLGLHMPLKDALSLSNSLGMAISLSFSFLLLTYAYKNLRDRTLSMGNG